MSRILVVGGSGGIGLHLWRRLLKSGHEVTVAARDRGKLEASTAGYDVASVVVLDATDRAQIAGFFDHSADFDHVVSLVGDSMSGGFLDTDEAVLRHVTESKFWANLSIAAAAAPHIQDGGSMVFTSGTGGLPHQISASYVANQSISTMVRALALELAPSIRVNAVAPTFLGTRTDFWRELPVSEIAAQERQFADAHPLRRLATLDEVVACYQLVIDNGYVNGQTISVDGGVMLPLGG